MPGGSATSSPRSDAHRRGAPHLPAAAPTLEPRLETHIGKRGGHDLAADGQHFARETHGPAEVARQMGKRGEKQVAQAVTLQSMSGGEPVLEKPGHQLFVFGQGHHAVADVARRNHVQLRPQPARAAAVVGSGDDRDELIARQLPIQWFGNARADNLTDPAFVHRLRR